MSKKPFIPLLVFDWDGTLMDSQARIVTRFQSAIADLDMEERSVAQIRHLIGLGAETVITTLFPNTSARTLSPSFF
ncbi:MAG: hypothetical protein DRR16_32590 [Candidatus Parabeggiatoa sp. nov. 3]|nr:MAG: hypothetical protein DRR00_25265 [Gammaproteobacteria bacterium]RKZ60073.1 MAG: hypothetical protein DRQ99_22690 [Gammaproteobacteria bacterium]RKZ73947.1 MAG: hypothetical protein DRR16_32590 [Gammaproteobacteria bacterium]HEW98002.1 hypothetical protein [Beggiatoa sp.]